MNHQVLIVEDETIVALDWQKSLTRLGYHVPAPVASGELALQTVGAQHPDIVLMDIHLRGAMDGIQAARAIHDQFATPVIFVTAHADEATLARARDANAYGFLFKPLDLTSAHGSIQLALAKHRQQTAMRTAVHVSHTRYRQMIETTNEGVCMVDPDNRIVFINARGAAMFGYTPEEMLGQSIALVLFPEDNEFAQAQLALHRRGIAAQFDLRFRRRDATPCWMLMSASPMMDAQNNYAGAFAMFADITERKQTERVLAATQKQLAAILNSVQDSVSVTDAHGKMIYANEVSARIAGYTSSAEMLEHYRPDQLSGLFEFFDEQGKPLSPEQLPNRRARRGETAVPLVIRYRTLATGLESWGWFHATPIFNAQRELEFVVTVIQDITALKAKELALEAALAEKQVMLREIFHRVKNNLQIVSSLLNLQAHHYPDAPTHTALLDAYSRVRAMTLIHEKLYQSPNLARIDFAEYSRHLGAFLWRSYRINPALIALDIQAADVWLEIDQAVPCGLILNELISNALKHAFPNQRAGRVIVELARQEPHLIALTVRDDGIGMSADFALAATTSLGLQLVQTLVNQLGGTVQVPPTPGACFQIQFPDPTLITGDQP